MRHEASFRCLNCRLILDSPPVGSRHRNHCPVCLWSKHVDDSTPGDRRSKCYARMKPIAICFKDYRINPFTNRGEGELMIVHECLNCGKVSPNRIAGDDNEWEIQSILKESLCLDEEIIKRLKSMGFYPISKSNIHEAFISLLGVNYNRLKSK